MTRTLINLMFATAVVMSGNLGLTRGADVEVAKPADPPPQFAVFSSYGCSRTFGMDSSHATLAAAIRQANVLRKDKAFVWVVAGKPGTNPQYWGSFTLIPGRRANLKLESCTVYESQCRGGWRVKATTTTAEDAESIVAEMNKSGGIGEVVYRLADK